MNNILLSELLLHFATFLSLFFLPQRLNVIAKFVPLFLCIFLSNVYGTIINGWNLHASLYAMRLFFLIYSGYLLGRILFFRFQSDLVGCLNYFVKIYCYATALGFLIFFLFPKSNAFWKYLSHYGIQYSGDPHIGRFISTYFDPNYYAAIAAIPLLFSLLLKEQTQQKRYLFCAFLFFISILFTWSRSGIATLFVLMLIMHFKKSIPHAIWKMRREGLIIGCIFFCVILFSIFNYQEEFRYFFDRLINIKQDYSAFYRFITFHLSWNIFKEFPLFGVGYNYLGNYTQEITGWCSVDSSLMTTLVNFGLVNSLFFLFCFFVWSVNQRRKFKSIKPHFFLLFRLFNLLYFYLIAVILFTSQFNNCLYYVFWLIPVMALFTYLNLCADEIRKQRDPDENRACT